MPFTDYGTTHWADAIRQTAKVATDCACFWLGVNWWYLNKKSTLNYFTG